MSFLRTLLTPLRLPSRSYSPKIIDVSQINNPQTAEMKKFLKQKGYSFTDPNQSSLKFVIPKHVLDPSTALPSKWKEIDSSLIDVYVDKKTGRISIPRIPLTATWRKFWSSLLKESPPLEPHDLTLSTNSSHLATYNAAIPIEELPIEEYTSLIKSLKISHTKLKPFHFSAFDVRVHNGKDLLFPVRFDSKNIVGIRRIFINPSSMSVEEENLFDSKNLEEERDENRLLPFFHGFERMKDNTQEIVLVSSVLDSVALISQFKDIVPIALAEGTRSLPPEHLPFFEHLQKVKIWFPNEEVRFWDQGLLFAKKFGETRTEIMSKELMQPYKYLSKPKGDAHFKDNFKNRMLPCKHEYVTTFEVLREDVKLEFMNFEKCQGTKWKRFPALNETLKGFRRGELTVFSGRTGSGKTTFISEFSLDLCMRGINTLWGSFEVKNVRLAKMQLKQYSLVNFEENIDEFDKWADDFQKLPMYYLTFHGSNDIRLILDAMLHSVYVYDIGHVIIDNVQFMMGTSSLSRGLDRLNHQDLIIEQFRKFATVHNVHVTLVIHPRKDENDILTANSVFGGAKATQEADNVIFLQTETSEVNSKQKKYLEIVKNRFSGDLGTLPLHFNKETLTFNKKTFKSEKDRRSKNPSISIETVPIPPRR
ncbi:twinkle mtDNA helicase [Lepeophtheirus salmonis]|uniref:twinkle mtDNA helicase n=1 Tax=Lepeophtheirus salmonis TaxID=72036 RepID=UPI001AE8F3DD|nr:twinkle protein, mitochondrial-like [Lepeophtheirus salmonis]